MRSPARWFRSLLREWAAAEAAAARGESMTRAARAWDRRSADLFDAWSREGDPGVQLGIGMALADVHAAHEQRPGSPELAAADAARRIARSADPAHGRDAMLGLAAAVGILGLDGTECDRLVRDAIGAEPRRERLRLV